MMRINSENFQLPNTHTIRTLTPNNSCNLCNNEKDTGGRREAEASGKWQVEEGGKASEGEGKQLPAWEKNKAKENLSAHNRKPKSWP